MIYFGWVMTMSDTDENAYEKHLRQMREIGTNPKHDPYETPMDRIMSQLPKREPQPVPPSPEDTPKHKLYGADHIGTMTRTALLGEIKAHQAKLLDDMSDGSLRHLVMSCRLEQYKERLHDEVHDTDDNDGYPFIPRLTD